MNSLLFLVASVLRKISEILFIEVERGGTRGNVGQR